MNFKILIVFASITRSATESQGGGKYPSLSSLKPGTMSKLRRYLPFASLIMHLC